jgi:hypothetical protein
MKETRHSIITRQKNMTGSQKSKLFLKEAGRRPASKDKTAYGGQTAEGYKRVHHHKAKTSESLAKVYIVFERSWPKASFKRQDSLDY